MALTTYRYVVSSIMSELRQSFPDAEIQTNQVLFWTRTIENQIRKRHLGTTPTGAFLVDFHDVPVIHVHGKRKYVELPSPIYDMIYEGGVEYITYERTTVTAFTQVVFFPTSPSQSKRLYGNPYEEPSPSHPYFYRIKNKIYFLGVENIKLKTVEMGLYTALDPRSSMVDLDDAMEINEEQLHQLRIELLNMGRFIMSIPHYRQEDGTDDREDKPQKGLQTTLGVKQQQQQEQQQQEEEI